MNFKKGVFERFENKATAFTGSYKGLVYALIIVCIWGVTGPIFRYSEAWQLIINTTTNVITFLMVFLIQKSQNKESKAIQLKLNELIAVNDRASNRMVDIEDLTEKELDDIHDFYARLYNLAQKEDDIHRSHSIDTAKEIHLSKRRYTNSLNGDKEKEK